MSHATRIKACQWNLEIFYGSFVRNRLKTGSPQCRGRESRALPWRDESAKGSKVTLLQRKVPAIFPRYAQSSGCGSKATTLPSAPALRLIQWV